jgi:GT2 family glycosyltransferase
MEELFWWAEDTEYCHWRIPQAGFPRRISEDAIVHHDSIGREGEVPPWKYYYEARNMLYLHLHVMHRLGWFPRNIAKLFARALVREKRGRPIRMWALMRGLLDGALGRLGIRYPVVPIRERSTTLDRRSFVSGVSCADVEAPTPGGPGGGPLLPRRF